MAVAVYTSDLFDIFLFESTTGVGAYGGGASGLGASPDYSIEGTNAVDKQVSASEKGFLFTASAAFVIGPHDHFVIWIILGVPGLADTRNNRGIHANLGDSTTAFVKYHVNGNDTLPLGGLVPYILRFNNTALTNRRTLVGSPGTSPDSIGGGANVTGTAKFSNLGCDAARIGTGYSVTGGTGADAAATFAGLASNDESTAEGIFQTADGGFKVQGKVRIGIAGTEGELTDLNTNLFIVNTLDGHVEHDLTEFIVSDDLSIFTLTNVNFITLGTHNRGKLEVLNSVVIGGQDETSYDNSPTTEGTFAAGSGYSAADVIYLDDGYIQVTVDAVDGGGAVTQFTVNGHSRNVSSGTTLAQSVVRPVGGTGFTLTPDTDNILTTPGVCTFVNVGFIDFGETILRTGSSLTGGRWVGADRIFPNGADLDNSTVQGFEHEYLIENQDETSYDNIPTTEGSFVAGTGYAVNDVITLDNGATINVDTLSGSAVATFTVLTQGRRTANGTTLTQESVAPAGGTGFTLTPEADNLESAALVWQGNIDPNGELDGMTFTKGTAPTHAIEFADDIPATITLTDVTLTGYSGSNGQKDSALWFRDTTGTITVNIVGGTSPTYKSDGATIVINNSVPVTVQGLTECVSVKVIANETVGTVTIGDVLFEGRSNSAGVASYSQNYEGAFEPSGLDIIVRARSAGICCAAIADDGGAFTDETDEANNATTNDMTLMPASPVVGDAYIFGHHEQFGQLKLDITTLGTGGTITWEYWNGAWTALSGVTDGTNSFANSGINIVSWTIPGDWATSTINGQGPFFYMRARFSSGTFSASPKARRVTLDVTRYLPFNQNNTISNTGVTVTASWVVDTIGIFG
jgi:hypothetical protein